MVRLFSSNIHSIIRLQLVFIITGFIMSVNAMNSTTNKPSIRYVVATLKTVIRRARSPNVGEPVVRWRLFNECSQGFLQSFLRTVNALGRREDVCLTHFIIWMRHVDGTIALQNAQTRHFLCLNKRLRPTTMTNGFSSKCRFREHMNSSGYTLLESAFKPGIFLGFGKSGHSINSTNHTRKRRCFLFNKLDSPLPNTQFGSSMDCTAAARQSTSTQHESHRHFVDPSFLNDIFQKSLHRVFA